MNKPRSHYAGVTAYIQNGPDNAEQFRVLAEAIPAFAPFADMSQPVVEKFQPLCQELIFRYTQEDLRTMTWQSGAFPDGTPDELKVASITKVVINGQSLSRIYLPVVGDDIGMVEMYATKGMTYLLGGIFGENLVTIKNRYASHRRSFADATTEIVVSAEKVVSA